MIDPPAPAHNGQPTGLFFADSHEKTVVLRKFQERIEDVLSRVDTIFLEAFYAHNAGGATIAGMTEPGIDLYLQRRNFRWTDQQAHDYSLIARIARDMGKECVGLDSPSPAFNHPMVGRMAPMAWRRSRALNSRWASVITDHMMGKAAGNRKYAVFGGQEHGNLLKTLTNLNLRFLKWSTVDDDWIPYLGSQKWPYGILGANI